MIGFAFDTLNQVDAKYFVPDNPVKKELKQKLVMMWLYTLKCCEEKHIDTLVISNVGGGAFSTFFP